MNFYLLYNQITWKFIRVQHAIIALTKIENATNGPFSLNLRNHKSEQPAVAGSSVSFCTSHSFFSDE